jgi:hypothetical protein
MIKTRKYRKSKSRRGRKSRRRVQRGGFGFQIPSNAIVEHRSMDDDGTNPPLLMKKKAMDEMISDSERA